MLARALPIVAIAALIANAASSQPLPRTADGKPDLQGIWQAHNRAAVDLQQHVARDGLPAGESVVVGSDEIPYKPAALAQKRANYANRATADPLAKCFLPGVPRIMYMEYPFQIFQTPEHVAITFEWSQVLSAHLHERQADASTKASSRGWATRADAGKATCSSSR